MPTKALFMLMMLLPLAACGWRGKEVANVSDARCMAMADSLRSLQVGDPLPRVREVLGAPNRQYRTFASTGGKYDVLEYDTGLSPCAKYLLDAPRKLVVMFDQKGQLAGFGRSRFLPLQGASTVRVKTGY